MCVNLELSVNGKFVAYGKMVKILWTLKSPCAKACYLIQKIDPAIERVYLLRSFGKNVFFHNLTTNSPVLIIIEPISSQSSGVGTENNLGVGYVGKTSTRGILDYCTLTRLSKFRHNLNSNLIFCWFWIQY